MNKVKIWFFKVAFSVLAFLLSCCVSMSKTPDYKINYGVIAPVTDAQVNPLQIDLAWNLACQMVGIDPYKALEKHQVSVVFEPEPIEWMGGQYYGLTYDNATRVWFQPRCLFDAESALLHEFTHIALWIKTGDSDSYHAASRWPLVENIRDFVESRICPEDKALRKFSPKPRPKGDTTACIDLTKKENQ